jgi:lipoic acid synthetase
MEPQENTWWLWLDEEHDAAFNMAADQVLLNIAGSLTVPLLRIYKWNKKAVTFGRSQLFPDGISNKFTLVRRPTGGGIVWHGEDLTYSAILPAEHPIAQMEIHESYQLLHAKISEQLGMTFQLKEKKSTEKDLLRMKCFDSPTRHDILGSDGTKYAGAAQYRTKNGTLIQGSILLKAADGNWERLRDMTVNAFSAFVGSDPAFWSPPEHFKDSIKNLVDIQFGTENWNKHGQIDKAPEIASDWLRVRSSAADRKTVTDVLADLHLNTVCASAHCPNLGKCFSEGVATFLILGNTCTRNCRFCAIGGKGHPDELQPDEAERLAEAVSRLELSYVVITSVTRDDLPDGGAAAFRDAILTIRGRCPGTGVEVLTPDFAGCESSLKSVLDARPDVFNHNVETVSRLSTIIRSVATYKRSLGVLASAARIGDGIPVKSGLMLGLGETDEEVHETLLDLRQAGVSLLTLGQYLPPTKSHYPLERIVSPEEFDRWHKTALKYGFAGVMSGPLVRSSFQARELLRLYRKNCPLHTVH